jgi:hypothetical protein
LQFGRRIRDRKIFTRLLILLRWPLSVLAALVAVLVGISGWLALSGNIPFDTFDRDVGVGVRGGTLRIFWHDISEGASTAFGVEFASGSGHWRWWDFSAEEQFLDWPVVDVSLWPAALLLATLASAGFWAKRRRTNIQDRFELHDLPGLLRRWLVGLRWVFAALAVLAIAALTATYWCRMSVVLPTGSGEQKFSVHLVRGSLDFWVSSVRFLEPKFILGFVHPEDRTDWTWWFDGDRGGTYAFASLPLWVVALPPLALALVGFRLRRTQPARGCCLACRYPLGGAAICPECGRPAPPN